MPAIQTPREPSQKTELPRDYPHKGISEDQKAKYKDLLEHLEAFDFQPPLSDNERFYLSEECLLRFLRATKWHVDSALIRIKNMLAWRRSWKGIRAYLNRISSISQWQTYSRGMDARLYLA